MRVKLSEKKRWVDTTRMLQRPVTPILKPAQLLMHVTHEDTVVPEVSPACKFERGKGDITIQMSKNTLRGTERDTVEGDGEERSLMGRRIRGNRWRGIRQM